MIIIYCFERDKDGFFNSEQDAFTEVCFVLTFVVPMEAAESHAIHHASFTPFTWAHQETVDLGLVTERASDIIPENELGVVMFHVRCVLMLL